MTHFTGDDIVKLIISDEPGQENLVEGIAINMDAYTLRRHISKNRLSSRQQIAQVRDKYCLTTYLHTLFLYGILDKLAKSENYSVDFEVSDFVHDVLKPYSSFLLSVDTSEAVMKSLVED